MPENKDANSETSNIGKGLKPDQTQDEAEQESRTAQAREDAETARKKREAEEQQRQTTAKRERRPI